MKITAKGQLTIPIEIREQLGLLPETEVEFEIDGDAVRVFKKSGTNGSRRGKRLLRQLKGSATIRMTTEEIMSLTRDS